MLFKFIFAKKKLQNFWIYKVIIKKEFKKFGKKTNIKKKINLIKYSEKNYKIIFKQLKKTNPEEIYYFAGQSSVGLSYKLPIETYSSNISLLFEILDYLRNNKLKTKIYNSSSTDCFGYSKNFLKKKLTNLIHQAHMEGQNHFHFGLRNFIEKIMG